MSSLLQWRWGPNKSFGIGTVAGICLVLFALFWICLDLLKITRQVEPPPFLEDFSPNVVELDGIDIELVEEANQALFNLGWESWPEPAIVLSGNPHEAAPDGVVRWHSCDSLLLVDGLPTPPCGKNNQKSGAAHVRLEKGHIVAADLYLALPAPKCRPLHEMLHARGFIISKEEDDKTPYVDGAHTEKPGHVLGETCGDGVKWLDRSEGGDWPYGEK